VKVIATDTKYVNINKLEMESRRNNFMAENVKAFYIGSAKFRGRSSQARCMGNILRASGKDIGTG